MMNKNSENVPASSQKGVDETRQHIIVVATQVFSEKGYSGATTRAIAALAGVNEVTLFRHFGNKKNLLIAVLENQFPIWELEALDKQFTGDYYQDLYNLGRRHLEHIINSRETILMMLSEVKRLPEVHEVISKLPRLLHHKLGRYLLEQMERGVLRELDTELAAQAFIGMFFEFGINLPLMEKSTAQVPVETVVRQLVDIFVEGTINREA